MNVNIIKQIVHTEMDKGEQFKNYHGITKENLNSFLVEPFEVIVDLDDSETAPKSMWVILQEYKYPKKGYVVVYDHDTELWGVAENITGDKKYLLVIQADSFAQALDGM